MSYLPYQTSAGTWIPASLASIATHAALALALMGAYGQILAELMTQDPIAPPQFQVTLERLDSDTLVGIVESEGVAGGDDNATSDSTSDPVTPSDTPDPNADTPEPEQIAAVEPDPTPPLPDPTEPDTVEPVAPEPDPASPDAAVPETPDTLEPTALAPVDDGLDALPEATAPDTVEPESLVALPEQPQTVEPEELALLEPGGSVAASAPVATPVPVMPDDAELMPILPDAVAGTTLRPTTPPPSGPAAEVATPERTVETVAAVTATAPVVSSGGPATPPAPRTTSPPPPPSAQDLAIGDLLRRIRAARTDTCLVALPRRDGTDGVGIEMIAATDSAMENFTNTVLTAEDTGIRQTRTLVDQRQCAALAFVQANVDYPATRLAIRVDNPEVQSGGRLTGILRGAAGQDLTLLLIDDNGVVQDLQRFLSFSGNLVRFDVPVSRSGPARDTWQVLLAIATPRPPAVIDAQIGHLAEDVFGENTTSLTGNSSLAVATFDVR